MHLASRHLNATKRIIHRVALPYCQNRLESIEKMNCVLALFLMMKIVQLMAKDNFWFKKVMRANMGLQKLKCFRFGSHQMEYRIILFRNFLNIIMSSLK